VESVQVVDSKISLNYRYPEDCCGKCTHAYQSTYGDFQCTKLYAGNNIDLGAICDAYHKELESDDGSVR
jgi:hypothetical protein